MAASGGYWLASQAGKIIASSPTDLIGSLGVVVEEVDRSKQDESQGITRRVYTSTDAPDKRIDTSTDEGQKKIIAQLDDIHEIFASRVASGRGLSIKKVNSDFGHGGLLVAEKALASGMIDEVVGSINKMTTKSSSKSIVNGNKTAAVAESKKEKSMDIITLKKDHPGVYAQAVQDGIKEERERRNALSAIAKADPENENLSAVVAEAIEQGTMATDLAFNTKVNVAIRDGKAEDGENPPKVETMANIPTESGLDADSQVQADAALALIRGVK